MRLALRVLLALGALLFALYGTSLVAVAAFRSDQVNGLLSLIVAAVLFGSLVIAGELERLAGSRASSTAAPETVQKQAVKIAGVVGLVLIGVVLVVALMPSKPAPELPPVNQTKAVTRPAPAADTSDALSEDHPVTPVIREGISSSRTPSSSNP